MDESKQDIIDDVISPELRREAVLELKKMCYEFSNLTSIKKCKEANNVYIERILNLVKYHMHHLYIIKNLPFARTSELVKEVDLNDMILMFVSDRLGRGQVEKENKLSEIEDIQQVIRILERNYSLDLNEIKEKIKKIKKII